MRARRLLLLPLVLAAATLAGCEEAPFKTPSEGSPAASAAAAPEQPIRTGPVATHTVARVAPDAPGGQAGDGVKLQVVKYDQLVAAVRAQRGKVIVLDVWGEFCVPCKKEFPNLVRLHQRFAGAGLVCMSVTVDEPDRHAAALKFLQGRRATFANFLLNEDAALWQERWRLKGVPAVFVFDRAGRRAAKFSSDDPNKPFTYEEVVRLVEDLLRQPR
jgi:thiol-disulfide isomerase/thioredoxin